MPRIERYTTDEPVPVKQAQVISPDAFPFSTASAEALKTIGGVIQELAIRKREAADSLAINAAGESRDIAKLKMQQFMLDNPDPDTWEEGARKIIEEQSKVYSKQRFSPQVKASEEIEQQAFVEELFANVQIASTVRTVDNDITVSGKNLINKIANDDGSPSSAADIDKQMKLYQEALLRKYDSEVATVQMEETLKEAKKAFYINQSRLFPDDIIARMQKKKKALGRGGRDKEGLEAKDYDDIISSAYMAKNLAAKSLDAQQEADRDAISKAIRNDDPDVFNLIDRSSLTETEQWTWSERAASSSSAKATGKDIVTDEEVKASLEQMAYDIWQDAASIKEVKKHLRIARYDDKTIDDTAYDELMSLALREHKSYQAKTMQEREDYALKQLVDLPGALDVQMVIREFETKAEKDYVLNLRQLQLDNYDKYKKALRDLVKDNPDWDANEIYKQSRSLLVQFRKTPEELREKRLEKPKEPVHAEEPKTKEEFVNTLRRLQLEDYQKAKEYYEKYLDRFY